MELVLLRHAPAGDKVKWRKKTGRPDAERPLTAAGRKAAKASARGLRRLWGRAELVASSPWVRARQTAEPAAKALKAKLIETDLMIPSSSPAALAAWLRARGEERIVLVGHEPHMSKVASWLLTGGSASLLEMKKAGALLLEARRPAPGAFKLRWSLPPSALKSV